MGVEKANLKLEHGSSVGAAEGCEWVCLTQRFRSLRQLLQRVCESMLKQAIANPRLGHDKPWRSRVIGEFLA